MEINKQGEKRTSKSGKVLKVGSKKTNKQNKSKSKNKNKTNKNKTKTEFRLNASQTGFPLLSITVHPF